MAAVAKEQVWAHFVGEQTPSEFLAFLDEEIAQGKFPDRAAGFLDYANFALTNLCVPPERQILYDGGWTVGTLAAELQHYAEKNG